jgi:peptidoglycan/xylan/chitin deacetylase (PgdA/CDA1 family)
MSNHDSDKVDLQDSFHLFKMDWLTILSKRVLPHGYWGPLGTTTAERERHLHLTFDDGPIPETTPALLDLLDEEQVKATFFILGCRAQRYPELVAEIAKRGHTIGNHSFNHLFMPTMSTKKIQHEIDATNQSIKDATGSEPLLFRPPFGLIDHRAASYLKERKMKTVYWSAVSEDWHGIGERRVISRTMQRLAHGALIVLHEGRAISKQTLNASREIIKRSKTKGFRFEQINLHHH